VFLGLPEEVKFTANRFKWNVRIGGTLAILKDLVAFALVLQLKRKSESITTS
jgi:hypothetical protein